MTSSETNTSGIPSKLLKFKGFNQGVSGLVSSSRLNFGKKKSQCQKLSKRITKKKQAFGGKVSATSFEVQSEAQYESPDSPCKGNQSG